MRFIVTYRYASNVGAMLEATEIVDMPRIGTIATLYEHALLYVRNWVDKDGVLVGVWDALSCQADVRLEQTDLDSWKGWLR